MTAAAAPRARAGWRGSPLLRPLVILGTWLALPLRPARRAVPNPFWPVRATLVAGTLAIVGLALATAVLADARAIGWARTLPVPLVDAFDFVTDFGRAEWFIVPLAALLLLLCLAAALPAARTGARVLTSLALRLWFVLLAVAVSGLATDVLKLVGRARPFVTGSADPFAFSLLDFRSDYQSLPSGHATTAFAAAVAVGALWPWTRPLMWAYAVVIGMSRVAVTAHHPSDVIVGAVVGMLGAVLVRRWFAARRLVFLVDAAQRLRPRPGPSRRRLARLARRLFDRSKPVALASR